MTGAGTLLASAVAARRPDRDNRRARGRDVEADHHARRGPPRLAWPGERPRRGQEQGPGRRAARWPGGTIRCATAARADRRGLPGLSALGHRLHLLPVARMPSRLVRRRARPAALSGVKASAACRAASKLAHVGSTRDGSSRCRQVFQQYSHGPADREGELSQGRFRSPCRRPVGSGPSHSAGRAGGGAAPVRRPVAPSSRCASNVSRLNHPVDIADQVPTSQPGPQLKERSRSLSPLTYTLQCLPLYRIPVWRIAL